MIYLTPKQTTIKKLKENRIKVINFEDLGEGSKYADIVVNAMYESTKTDKKIYTLVLITFVLKRNFILQIQKVFISCFQDCYFFWWCRPK